MTAELVEKQLAIADALKFMLAGNAIFTLRSNRTGMRFTYWMQAPKDLKEGERPTVWFVKLLIGPQNTTDYQYIGMVRNKRFTLTKASQLSGKAPAVVAIEWTLKMLFEQIDPHVEIWHAGRCGRCGLTLTVPESIERGLGPKCAGLA